MKPTMLRPLVFIFLALTAGTVAMLNGNILGFRSWSWHQKLTIEVQTPDGVKTGSSVSEAKWEMAPEWFKVGDSGGGHGEGSIRGEAVIIELAPERYLFALLKRYSAETAIRVFAVPTLRSDNRNEYMSELDRIVSTWETKELSFEQYPLLVTFGDINDPASLKRVDPANLKAAFGSGYRLIGITLTLTDEPVTTGTRKKVLSRLAEVGRERATLIPNPPRLQKDATDPEIQYLTPGSFSTELYK